MNLYAFLVGINSYPLNPLTQCVNDVKKMEDYLNTLGPSFSGMEIKMLFDREATKQAIVAGIGDSFSRATDDDVCLFYYSGHGGQEFAGGRFTDEHDGLLECLVACPEPGQKEGYLLADKEIRYLLTQLPSNPHLVTVFDCCHSGDMVRGMAGEESQSRRKRLSKLFSARDYSGFIFSKALTEKDLKQKSLSEVIPYKNHIHLAACLPDESSWEDTEGGVFTRYLLQLLKSNDNRLNYRDIAKWARVSMMDVTSTRQTPTFSIQGTGKVRDTSSWLNLFPEDCSPPAGKLIYNYDSCWNYTRGQLMGIKEGMPIKIYIDGNKTKFIESVITKVKMESSEIEDPMKNNYQLDTNREYDVSTDTTFSKPTLYINNLENETELQAAIEKMIRTGDLAT